MSIKLRYFINLATAPLVFMHLASDLPDDEAAALPWENVRFFIILYNNIIIIIIVVVVINYIHYYITIFFIYIL